MKNNFTKIAFLAIFMVISVFVKAQYDTIVYINGARQAAKIIEVSDKYVKFKNPLDTLGPTFSLPTKQIQRFVFKNGGLNKFSDVGVKDSIRGPKKAIDKDEAFKRTIIGVDLLQACIARFQLNAEHIFKGGLLALNVYLNVGLRDSQDTSTYKKLECRITNGYYKNTYGGIDLKIYPGLQKKIAPFISLGFEIGGSTKMITQGSNQTIYNWWGGYYISTSSSIAYIDRTYYGYHASFGAIWRVTKRLVIQYNLSIGLNQFKNQDATGASTSSDFSPKIGAGLILAGAF
jgi:hypothetical protein